MGMRKVEKQENQGSRRIEAGKKRLTDVTTSMKKWKKIHRKDKDTEEQEK